MVPKSVSYTHPHTGRRTDMHRTLNLSSRGGGCEDIRTNCARRISFLEQFSVPFILLSVRSTLFTLLHSTKIPFYRERKAPTHIFTKYSRPTLSYLPAAAAAGNEWLRLGRIEVFGAHKKLMLPINSIAISEDSVAA